MATASAAAAAAPSGPALRSYATALSGWAATPARSCSLSACSCPWARQHKMQRVSSLAALTGFCAAGRWPLCARWRQYLTLFSGACLMRRANLLGTNAVPGFVASCRLTVRVREGSNVAACGRTVWIVAITSNNRNAQLSESVHHQCTRSSPAQDESLGQRH